MKYKLFEEYNEQQNDEHPDFYETEEEIREWLEENNFHYRKNTCTINEDWSVDVDGAVHIANKKLTYIRIKFNEVKGYFNCRNNNLKSLEGVPDVVYGNFFCEDNNLKSLEGSPDVVYGDFDCKGNGLTSLEGGPGVVGAYFDCSFNNLITLQYAPDVVKGKFNCRYNKNLVTLAHKSDIKGDFRHDELQGTLNERWNRYINYLDTLDEDGEKSSLQWLYDVDEEFRELVVRYSADNNIDIDAPGTDMAIASQASKHKDSGLF